MKRATKPGVNAKPEPKKVSVYSTLFIGSGGAGSQSIFTVPQGQRMASILGPEQRCAHCGSLDPAPVQTIEHTNMTQAGVFGAAIGDGELFSIQARFFRAPAPTEPLKPHPALLMFYALRIGGIRVTGGSIADIIEAKPLPRVKIRREDSLEVELGFERGTSARLDGPGGVLCRVEMWGNFL